MFYSYTHAHDPHDNLALSQSAAVKLYFGVTIIPPNLHFNKNNIVSTCSVYLESVNW